MASQQQPTGSAESASTDYFGDDDSAYLNALQDVTIPEGSPSFSHDRPDVRSSVKRPRSPGSSDEEDDNNHHRVLSSVDHNEQKSQYLKDETTYGAASFGGFGEYMARKRAKLQIQNAELDVSEDMSTKGKLFTGLQIHINGFTRPSVQDLRKLIIEHGGVFHAYLDKKTLVTHVLTCSLTPAKVREFQHMKVVKPDWLVESVKAGVLLPWQDFIFKVADRAEASQGRKVGQTSLRTSFVPTASTIASPTHSVYDDIVPDSEPEGSQGKSSKTSDLDETQEFGETPTDALNVTDPATASDAKRVPGYASHKSNPNAQRAMADPAWRAAHTSVAPDFIEGYYRNSRLHHLSTWKAELKNLVVEALEKAEKGSDLSPSDVGDKDEEAVSKVVRENMAGRNWVDGSNGTASDLSMKHAQLVMRSPSKKGKERERPAVSDEEKVIMHCDFDSFFVSAGLVERPHLKGKPVVVCHSQGSQGGQSSTSEIASASYEARKFGVKGGMSLQQARKLCPEIITIPYEFQKYKQYSLQFYTILMSHADDLQAVSVDEALIDVTSSVRRIRTEISQSQRVSSPTDPAKDFAEAIRAQVKSATSCEVSIGIAHNIMLARVASRRAKPAGSFHILPADVPQILAPLDINDLHGFGYATRQKAKDKLGATNLGELSKKSKGVLCEALGKGTGETLYKALRGIDDRKLESDKPRKSVSCDINYGIRFENNEQAEAFVYQMAEEVSRRLVSIEMRGRSITLKVMKRDPSAPVEAPKFLGHGVCETFTKQSQLIAPGGRATSDNKVIGDHAWRLLKGLNFDPKELRGIGVQIQKLEKASSAPETEQGQGVLPFAVKTKPVKDSALVAQLEPSKPQNIPSSQSSDIVEIKPPSNPEPPTHLELPSFSQVDQSVFNALPEDVRKELELEYKRRSASPARRVEPVAGPSKMPLRPQVRFKIAVKGSSGPNVKRITQQLAPRNRASLSPKKSTLFTKRTASARFSSVQVTEEELHKLHIDPMVFVMLPLDLQREQLTAARIAKSSKNVAALFGGPNKSLKPVPRLRPYSPGRKKYVPPPPPQARHPIKPVLKQKGPKPGEKLLFTDKDDVQNVIGIWVSRFLEHPPNQQDVNYFAKFLTQCAESSHSGDRNMETAIGVMKWWMILLRRHFGVYESSEDEDLFPCTPGTTEAIGRAWWKAFREVKDTIDSIARKRFGGILSLR